MPSNCVTAIVREIAVRQVRATWPVDVDRATHQQGACRTRLVPPLGETSRLRGLFMASQPSTALLLWKERTGLRSVIFDVICEPAVAHSSIRWTAEPAVAPTVAGGRGSGGSESLPNPAVTHRTCRTQDFNTSCQLRMRRLVYTLAGATSMYLPRRTRLRRTSLVA